jgi:hypothetical protein
MSRIGKIIDFTGVFSWKWAWISGICYTSLGIVYIILKGLNNPMVHGPLFMTGILFLLGWILRKEIKKAHEAYDEG